MGVKMAENIANYPDRIAEFYKDKTIFITGGTGFVGRVLIEKLLRSFSNVKKIIIMIRTKKGKHPQDRIKDVFAGPLFDMVKKERGPDIIKKVVAVVGDVSALNLGICKEDREMLANEVDIIFHCAATIRFDETLKTAVLLNTRGTQQMLELAKECKKLQCFSYLSTAYCHLHERVLYEKPYNPPADPYKVIKTAEWLSEETLEKITPKILGDVPNTYAFSKALSESLVVEQKDKIPVVILRPSIVVPIWREPLPGWTDNINGPTGLLIAAGKGVLRTMYMKEKSYADYVPVDITVNAMLVCVHDYIYSKHERWIFHVTSSDEYKLTMGDIIDLGRKVVSTRIPLNGVAWYPGGGIKRSKIVHLLSFFLFHLVPAVFVDLLLLILGYKPVLLRVQKRIWKGYEVFEYYTNNQWDFNNAIAMQARAALNPRERDNYKVDGNGIDYFDYFTECVHAARLYILKETDDTLPAARRHMQVMWFVDKFCKTLFIVGMLYLLYQKVLSPLVIPALSY